MLLLLLLLMMMMLIMGVLKLTYIRPR